MKENQTIKPVIDMAAGTVTFQIKGLSPLILDMNKVHADNIRRASFVGMAQVRIIDRAAIPAPEYKQGMSDADKAKLKAVQLAEKRERMASLISHYESGSPDWSVKGEAAFRGGILFQCLCAMQPDRDPETIKAWLEKQPDAVKAKLLASSTIKPYRDAIEAARVGNTEEAETALQEFLTVPA